VITSGNGAIIKPSEVSANCSAVIAKFVSKYLDPDLFSVIEGGVDVAVALNQQKLDMICFTGSTMVGKIVA